MVITGSATTRRRSGSTPATPAARNTPAKRKRGSSSAGRPGRTAASISQHAKEQHEAEATALTEGIDQLQEFIAALQLLREGGSPPQSDDLPRDWMSEETLIAMTEVIDENPRPSLEYVLGVLGATTVPKRLTERQRSQGARAFTSHLRNRAIRRKREAIEEKKKRAAEEAAAEKERIAREKAKEEAEREKLEKQAKEEAEREELEKQAKEKADGKAAGGAGSQDGQKIEAVEKPDAIPATRSAPDLEDKATDVPVAEASVMENKAETADSEEKAPVSSAKPEDSDGKTTSAADLAEAEILQGKNKSEESKTANEKSEGAPQSEIALKDLSAAVSIVQNDSDTSAKPMPVPLSEKAIAQDVKPEDQASGSKTTVEKTVSEAEKEPVVEKQTVHFKTRAGRPAVERADVHAAEKESAEEAMDTTPAVSNAKRPATTTGQQPLPETKAVTETDKDVVMDDINQSLEPEKVNLKPESKDAQLTNVKSEQPVEPSEEKPVDMQASPSELDLASASAATAAAAAAVSNNSREPESNHANLEKKAVEVSAPALEMTVETKTVVETVAPSPENVTKIATAAPPKKIGKSSDAPPEGSIDKEASKEVETSQIPPSKSLSPDCKKPVMVDSPGDKKPNVVDTKHTVDDKVGASMKKKETEKGKAVSPTIENRSDAPRLTVPPRKAMSPTRVREKEPRGKGKEVDGEPDKVGSKNKAKEEDDSNAGLKEKLKAIAKEEEVEKNSENKGSGKGRAVKKIEHRVPKKRFQDATDEHLDRSRRAQDSNEHEKGARSGDAKGKTKDSGNAAKGRKQKDGSQKGGERRGGSRRKGFRERVVAAPTRLRRESSRLHETPLPRDADPFIVDCYHVWKSVNDSKIALPFRKPVTTRDAPEYFEVVKHPMDLSTVRKHLEDGTIATPEDFYSEMLLICSNAVLFNDAESDLYELAQELRQMIRKAVKPVLKSWRAAGAEAKEGDGGTGGEKAGGKGGDLSDSDSGGEQGGPENSRAGRYAGRGGAAKGAARGRRRGGRGRGKMSGKGVARGTDEMSDEDMQDVVIVPPPRGRRGGRGGRRGGRDAVGKRIRVEEEVEEGRKKRRISGRKRKEEERT